MRGHLHPTNGLPIIEVVVNERRITCLVDTGFTGDLAVGVDMANMLSLVVGRQRHTSDTVAGGTRFRTSIAQIEWFGTSRQIGVAVYRKDRVGPVDGIIGVHLLVGYILVADFMRAMSSLKIRRCARCCHD